MKGLPGPGAREDEELVFDIENFLGDFSQTPAVPQGKRYQNEEFLGINRWGMQEKKLLQIDGIHQIDRIHIFLMLNTLDVGFQSLTIDLKIWPLFGSLSSTAP
jgi:hypothetical protein